jgi:hypothetical protein
VDVPEEGYAAFAAPVIVPLVIAAVFESPIIRSVSNRFSGFIDSIHM